jgi:hypothetical protein
MQYWEYSNIVYTIYAIIIAIVVYQFIKPPKDDLNWCMC